MTATGTCPTCGTARTGERFCGKCGHDFWRAADGSPPAPSLTDQPHEPKRRGMSLVTRILVFLIGAGIVVIFALGGASSLFKGGTEVQTADVPPAGEIWFGSTFDRSTFELTGRTSTVSAHGAFAMVAHTSHSLNASEIVTRIYFNGGLVGSQQPNATGSGDLWGFAPGPLFEPGDWKYEITDIGGNVLASGTITAK